MNLLYNFKFLDFLLKYTSGKTDNMPLYQGNDVSDYIEAGEHKDIKLCKPAKKGLSPSGIDALISMLVNDDKVNLAGFGMLADGELVSLYHNKPYEKTYRHVSFSMCKSVIAMAVGIAGNEGLIRLDEKLSDIFKAHYNIFMKKGVKEITVYKLLTMTTGIAFDEVASFFVYDWRKAFMSSDTHAILESGFSYNSMNTYMLAAIIAERAKMSVMDYLQLKLFDHMNIHDITWDRCPMGIEKGGYGMKLSVIDMLKLGQLYLNFGSWNVNGKPVQLIPREWIEESSKTHIRLERGIIEGYGYQIWTLKDGSILFNGLFGQNVYINRERRIVIATSAAACDTFPDGRIVNRLVKYAADDSNFKPNILDKFPDIKLKQPFYILPDSYYKKELKRVLGGYFGIEYKFDNYAGSIVPITIQVLYSIYSTGISKMSVGFVDDDLLLKVSEGSDKYSLRLGYSRKKPFVHQIITVKGKKLPVAAGVKLVYDEDNNAVLKVRIMYMEEAGITTLKLMFDDNRLRLRTYEFPELKTLLVKLVNEEYIKKRNIGFSLKRRYKTPEFMKYEVERLLAPDVVGKADM